MVNLGMFGAAWLWSLLAGRVAIVSSSQVAAGQPPLHYADRDAERMASVLRDLGGFDRVQLIKNVDAEGLRHALALAQASHSGDTETQLFIYYSGHADKSGLLLGKDHFPFRELREKLASSTARVRVAMIDACHAGQAVNSKGARASAPFDIPRESSLQVSGVAILAASTASELAQESSELGGSYFTHHVLSALRGAGDANGDGEITLQEAYEYAYGRTVASTMPNFFGSQHPTFEYRLAGSGDLVLTRLLREPSILARSAEATNYLVVNTVDGVVAEFASSTKMDVRIALRPGSYRILKRHSHGTLAADFTLKGQGTLHLDSLPFKSVKTDLALAKGSHFQHSQDLTVGYGVVAYAPGLIGTISELQTSWLQRRLLWSWGPLASYGQRSGDWSGVKYELKRIHLAGEVVRRVPLGFSEISLGVRLGVMGIYQDVGSHPNWGLASTSFAVFKADVPVAPWVSLRLDWSAGGLGLKVEDSYLFHPELQTSVGLAFFF